MRYLVLLLLVGCADYTWERRFPESREREWVVVPDKAALHRICAIDEKQNIAACAFQIQATGKCWIYSVHTEEEAKRLYAGDKDSLWEHEMKHCQGWRH